MSVTHTFRLLCWYLIPSKRLNSGGRLKIRSWPINMCSVYYIILWHNIFTLCHLYKKPFTGITLGKLLREKKWEKLIIAPKSSPPLQSRHFDQKVHKLFWHNFVPIVHSGQNFVTIEWHETYTIGHILPDAGLLWHVAEAVGEEGGVDLPNETLPPEGTTSRHQQENICQNWVNISLACMIMRTLLIFLLLCSQMQSRWEASFLLRAHPQRDTPLQNQLQISLSPARSQFGKLVF